MKTDWIDNRVSLASVMDAMQGLPRLALDTEFERVRTFWPKLALVQIALEDRVALVDPLTWEDPALFGTALHQGTSWLMHSASEDLVALKPLSPQMPTRLFDTQMAAALCGLGAALSYQKLVKLELDIDLPKGETRSDWLQRPLSAAQLEYAADDVLHLDALADRLGDRLEKMGRLDWLMQDGERQIAASWLMPYGDNPHHDFRTAYKLSLDAQRRLCALMHWREQTARSEDRPRTWVLDNGVAMDLAHSPPANSNALLALVQASRAFPKRRASEVLDVLAEANCGDTFKPAPEPLDRDTEKHIKTLRERIDAHAIELGIEPATLCTRKLLEARVRDGQWPTDCTPWRIQQLEPLITA